MSERLVLRPAVAKSFVKGTIAIAVFSVFLQVNPSNVVKYLLFLGLYYAFIGCYMYLKHAAAYTIDEAGITLKGFLHGARLVPYSDIVNLSIAQGLLARRFGCGTVFIDTKGSAGSARTFEGSSAEALRDVRNPTSVVEAISSRLSRM
jgi:membrane protein YdbS with pleckstrin-like domain